MDNLPFMADIILSCAGRISSSLPKHYIQRKKVTEKVNLRNDLLYDEAFGVAQKFFERAMYHSVEDLQKFGNAFMPSPPWVRIVRDVVPKECLQKSAKVIIDTLGEAELKEVVGGTKWWQMTTHRDGGVDAEWICMKKDYKEQKKKKSKDREANDPTDEYASEMDDMITFLYFFGGGFFFGSPNTHRYMFWRFARKVAGRVFAPVYRLSPQYPFPCALQDALASYLYLIRPPPGAKHKPVDPKKIVIGGDSAGGNLALTLLCLIRDAGLPAPGGSVLISPWCDLTHSFPSITSNTETDFLSPFGFLFKPSTLWPPPPPEFTKSTPNYKIDTDGDGIIDKKEEREFTKHILKNEEERQRDGRQSLAIELGKEAQKKPGTSKNADAQSDFDGTDTPTQEDKIKTEPKIVPGAVKPIMIDGHEVTITEQIQTYATNEQIIYPFVSPVYQPSLGGLPPLFIIAGDKEVLRDEIIYTAHKAAHPEKYPLRDDLLNRFPERAKKHAQYPPTKVHLQVYDDIPHELCLFSFIMPAKYAYRAVASFVVSVTTENPPEPSLSFALEPKPPKSKRRSQHLEKQTNSSSANSSTHTSVAGDDSPITVNYPLDPNSDKKKNHMPKDPKDLNVTIYSAKHPFNRPKYEDNMIRERVAINGVIRPLESEEQLPATRMKPDDIGYFNASVVKRYLVGKALMEKKFKNTIKRVHKERIRHIRKSQNEEAKRLQRRQQNGDNSQLSETVPKDELFSDFLLEGENPPPSCIAGRKDTKMARKLAGHLEQQYSSFNALRLWNALNSQTEYVEEKKESD